MNGAKGALLFDGWTCNATHYVGMYAIYCREIQFVVEGQVVSKNVLCTPFLSVSPMTKVNSTSGNKEAEKFEANVHIHHLCNVFYAYSSKALENFAFCTIADN